jgi:hypothetical protein
MSETVLRFMAEELERIRVLCQNGNCKAVIEVEIHDIDRHFRVGKCPFCNTSFNVMRDEKTVNALVSLQEAFENLKMAAERLGVQFVLPVASHPDSLLTPTATF